MKTLHKLLAVLMLGAMVAPVEAKKSEKCKAGQCKGKKRPNWQKGQKE